MTEEEWLKCTDPIPMLKFITGKASDRKLRLFACACCRRIWHLLTDERVRKAVIISERYADGMANEDELEAARLAFRSVPLNVTSTDRAILRAIFAIRSAMVKVGISVEAQVAAKMAADAARSSVREAWQLIEVIQEVREVAVERASQKESKMQLSLLRDIFGNPFHKPTAIDADSRTFNDTTISKLAQAIYDERRFEDMPLLADALMDAGCHNEDILNHCRGPGPHVGGCWVVDLLLRKE